MSIRTLLTGVALLSTTGWAQYVLEDNYFDGNFFDNFSFFTSADPTHGFVNYVDRNTASNANLINNDNGQAYMGVDHTNNAPNGRNAVRVTSNKSYNGGLIILDAARMPGSVCGAWPAFWMVGPNWPNSGEIDIIEGVNDQATNDMTLHTSDGCSISSSSSMTGIMNTKNCYVNAAGQSNNQGCGITTGNTLTYGTGFNNNGGGVYATEWTSSAIKIYFFPRNAIPSDITNGTPNPSGWGSPIANFAGGCDINDHFKDLQIVFNIAMCGDWAGGVWASSTCAAKASSCNAFVANNPSAFQDAYWLINSLKVYQPGASTASTVAASSSSSHVQSASPTASPSTVLGTIPTTASNPAPDAPVNVTMPAAHQAVNVTMPRKKGGRGRRALADLNEWLHFLDV